MLQPILKEIFRDEEQIRYGEVIQDLQKQITEMKHENEFRRENDILREVFTSKINSLHETINTQRAEIQEQRILLLKMMEIQRQILEQLCEEPTEQVDLEDSF